MLKYTISIFILCSAHCLAESYFFKFKKGEELIPKMSVVEKSFKMRAEVPIEKVDPPLAISITAIHQGYEGRTYHIQVHLRKHPGNGWLPMIKLGDDILAFTSISTSMSADPKFASSFSIESDDKEGVIRWVKDLKVLLKLEDKDVYVDLEPDKQE